MLPSTMAMCTAAPIPRRVNHAGRASIWLPRPRDRHGRINRAPPCPWRERALPRRAHEPACSRLAAKRVGRVNQLALKPARSVRITLAVRSRRLHFPGSQDRAAANPSDKPSADDRMLDCRRGNVRRPQMPSATGHMRHKSVTSSCNDTMSQITFRDTSMSMKFASDTELRIFLRF